MMDPLLEQTEYHTLRRRRQSRRSSAFFKQAEQQTPPSFTTIPHTMAPRTTRAAARAAAVDVHVHVDEVEDDRSHSESATEFMGSSPKKEDRKALETIAGNAEAVHEEEQEQQLVETKPKKKKKGTKKIKRKSEAVHKEDEEIVEAQPVDVEPIKQNIVSEHVVAEQIEQHETSQQDLTKPVVEQIERDEPIQQEVKHETQQTQQTGIPVVAEQDMENIDKPTLDVQSIQQIESTPSDELSPRHTPSERPCTPVLEVEDAGYFPDYEHASPVRVAAKGLTDMSSSTDTLTDLDQSHQEDVSTSVIQDIALPGLQVSLEQLSLQNEYKLAEEIEEDAPALLVPFPTPVDSTMISAASDLLAAVNHAEDATYMPSSNDHDSDPYIPDYEAAHIASPATFDHKLCQEKDELTQPKVESAEQKNEDQSGEESSDAAQRLEALFQPAPGVDMAPAPKSSMASLLDHTRPEDPIAALDALQEAIDEVESSLPTLSAMPAPRTSGGKRETLNKSKPTSAKKPLAASMKPKRPVDDMENILPAASSPKVQQVKQRSAIAALNTPPKAVKSNKPVTKSTFQLPGEAIAAKLKAQREERMKREEEEEKKRKECKARPIMKTTKSHEVKDTLKSKARVSMMSSSAHGSPRLPEAGNTVSKAAVRPSMPAARGSSTLRLATQGPRPAANTSSLRSKPTVVVTQQARKPAIPAATLKKSITREPRTSTSRPSLPSSRKSELPAVVAIEAKPRPRATGAEVFKRPMMQKAMEEKALKDRIEAQKKAKAEAAERSRQLSREFAARKAGSKAGSRNVSASNNAPGAVDEVRDAAIDAVEGVEARQAVEA